MKRSPLPDRRTPLARGNPPKRTPWVKARSQIKPVSDKRRAEADERARVRQITISRAFYGCELRDRVVDVKCWHPDGPQGLDVHEKAARSVAPGGHLDENNTIAVCRAHHDWIDDHIPEAEALGVYIRSWNYERP